MRAAAMPLLAAACRADGVVQPPRPVDWRGCTATPLSLDFPSTASVEDWRIVGCTIRNAESAVQWWLGDWWRFGDRYGKRVAVVRSDDWDGPSIEACRNAASICSAFDVSRRRDTLRFGHHAEVASLPSAEADALLDWAEETIATSGRPRSTRELRAEVARRRQDGEAKRIVVRVEIVPSPSIPRVFSAPTIEAAPADRSLSDQSFRSAQKPLPPHDPLSVDNKRVAAIIGNIRRLASYDGAGLGSVVSTEQRTAYLLSARAALKQLQAFIAALEG